jgi:hypothetical protein
MLSEMGARFATMYLVISFVIILWLGSSIALYLYLKNREEREESKKKGVLLEVACMTKR